MALFNPKIPELKFDPSMYNLSPYGFGTPGLDTPSLPDYSIPSLPSAMPEPSGGDSMFNIPEGGSFYMEAMPTPTPGSLDFSGIEPYTTPTSTSAKATAKAPAYPTTTTTSAYSPRKPYSTKTPYGSKTFWKPQTGATVPTMGDLPEYMTPTMDRARISELTELGMGAPMGRLKEGLNRALLEARYSTNPMVRAMARKRALSGYGTGISDVRTGAHREAMGEYMPEFQAKLSKSQAEYQAKIQKIRDQFQSDIQDYIRKGTKITSPLGWR